jgi:hypothetical protein
MKQVIVTGNIRNGKLELLDQAGFRRDMAITFPTDCIVDVIIERRGKKRTNPQNRWLWGVAYKILSDHTGYSEEEIHEICKFKFNRKEYHLGDETFILGGSTAIMTTIEFMEYKTNIQQLGAELGCVIPDPNETLEILNEGLELTKGE